MSGQISKLTFLGTGGGRFACILQARATGGLYLQLERPEPGERARFHIDPGPGALVRMLSKGLDPLRTDAILVSHCHPDHYADAEILIEGMTRGGRERAGAFLASRSVINGVEGYGPAISKYHRERPRIVRALSAGESATIMGIEIRATPSAHSDPSSVGFRLSTPRGVLGYLSDTALSDEVTEAHKGSRVLILPVTSPLGRRIPHHLNVEDAARICEAVRPELALLTHFGMRVICEGPALAAEEVQRRSGVTALAAEDGMEVEMGDTIRLLENSPPAPPLNSEGLSRADKWFEGAV
ncbi:MAG: MBL fold metallo-hydrolase [Thermoplasmata archaeon]